MSNKPMGSAFFESHQDARRAVIFAFAIGDRVAITELKRPGRVVGLCVDYLGVQYNVAYFDCGERRMTWLFEDDLKPA